MIKQSTAYGSIPEDQLPQFVESLAEAVMLLYRTVKARKIKEELEKIKNGELKRI